MQLTKLNSECELFTTRLTETSRELFEKSQDQRHWHEQFHSLQEKWNEQNALFMEEKTQNVALSQEIKTLKLELKDSREQNKILAHEEWILGQEKAQLYGQFKQLESSI